MSFLTLDIVLFLTNAFAMFIIIRGDISLRRISNEVCLLVICISTISAALHGFFLPSLLNSVIVFLVFFLIWRLGIMGAGDVKLIAAYSIGIVPELLIGNLVFIGLIGGVQISVMYINGILRGTTPFDKGIPYGVAISISGVIFSYISTF